MSEINYEFLESVFEKEKKDKKKKKSGFGNKFRWGIIFVLIGFLSFSVFLGFAFAIFSRFMLFETILALAPGEKLIPQTNILIMGLDKGRRIHRSDTLMVVNFDPRNNEANIINIPRDTLVSIPGRGLDKVNHSYAYGGAELTRRTVEKFFKINIPHYISVDIAGLEKMIDELGGIKINVEKRMYYVDYAQNLFVNLYPGEQVLSGRDCLSYIRYRQDGEGDFGRIFRQQKFVKAMIHQILGGHNLFKSPQLLLKLSSYLDTNLDTKEIFGFILSIRKIWEYGQIKMDSLTGTPIVLDGVFYLEPDPLEVHDVVQNFFAMRNRSPKLHAGN
ncbi:LCP family protein [Candidatus Margulisiibacteriota bacterium]